MNPRDLAKRVEETIRPVLEEEQIELVDVLYLSECGRWVLRIHIDKPGGVTVDECAAVSRNIEDIIDVSDVILHKHSLEVSSPGLDRVLIRERDFQRFEGRIARIVLKECREGRKNFKGRIVRSEKGIVELRDSQETLFQFHLHEIQKARLEYETPFGKRGSRQGPVLPRKQGPK